MKISNAKAPKWANENRTAIDLTVTIDGIGEVPFTASADDVEEHGRQLFAQASAGDFGAVGDYVPPPGLSVAEKRAAEIRSRLATIDTESVRAMRATVAATAKGKQAPAFDANKLETLEAEAASLRAELAALGG
jgi:hypothetical protein